MAFAEEEDIPVGMVRVYGVDRELSPVQLDQDVHAGQCRTEVGHPSLVRKLDQPAPDLGCDEAKIIPVSVEHYDELSSSSDWEFDVYDQYVG